MDGVLETRRLRWRIGVLLALKYELTALAISALVLGAVVLVLRATTVMEVRKLLWAVWGFVPGAIWALGLALHRIPSRAVASALIDGHSRCGGLLMASREAPLEAWLGRLKAVRRPVVKWRAGRLVGLSVAALTFLAASFLLPQRYMEVNAARPLNIADDVRLLEERIQTLEEEQIVSAETAEVLREELEQLQERASGRDPVKTWETLDHIAKSLEKTAADFAESALSQTEALAQSEALAEGVNMTAGDMSPEELAQAMAALGEMVKGLTAADERLKQAFDAETLSACENGTLSAEQLAELLKALKGAKLDVSECLGRLCEAGLIDPEMIALCEKMGQCDMEGLKAFLDANGDAMGLCEALCSYCQSPGRGGVTRGRGDAPMTWTDGSSEEGTAFKEQILPPASLEALKDAMLVGVSSGAPTVVDGATSDEGRALNVTEAGSGDAFRQEILPRHKGAVERYFKR